MKRLLLSLAIWSLLIFHPTFGQSESQSAIAGDHTAQLFPSDGIPEPTRTIKVSSLGDLEKEIAAAKPGDRIVLADGIYTSAAPIKIDRQGTAEHPIVISAQTIGGAEITGVGSFAVGNQAQYVVIEGYKFTHSPAIINIPAGANHCRISRNLFELAITGRSPYLVGFRQRLRNRSQRISQQEDRRGNAHRAGAGLRSDGPAHLDSS